MVRSLIFLFWHFFQSLKIYSIEGFDFNEIGEGAADFKVIVKHVGQGSCTIIENQRNGKIAITDAGSSASTPFNLEDEIIKDLGEACTRRSLPAMNGDITLVVSHSDQDHIDLIHGVFTKNSRLFAHAPCVILGDHFANYYKSSYSKALLRRVIKNLRNPPDQVIILSHNTAVTSDLIIAEDDSVITGMFEAKYNGYKEHIPITGFLSYDQEASGHVFEILSANAGARTKDFRDENTNSAVVRLGINKKNILIMGDATGITTQRILLNPENKKMLKGVSLLVSSHHGGRLEETNNGLWLGFTSPERVAISAGYHGGYKHPNAEFLMDLIIVDSLVPNTPHDIAFSGPEESLEYYVESLKAHMGIKEILQIQNKEKTRIYKWLIFTTHHAVHSTGSSGSLYYIYNIKGELVSFWKEN